MFSKRHMRRLVSRKMSSLIPHDYDCDCTNSEDSSSEETNLNNDTNSVYGEEESNNNSKSSSIVNKLQEWYSKHRVSRDCFDDILNILRSENIDVPSSSKSIIKTNKAITRTVSPGSYLHIGLKNQLSKVIQLIKCAEIIKVDFNIDGIPLYKSSQLSLWPILAKIIEPQLNVSVFPVGIYLGEKKPHSVNNFLHDLARELLDLTTNGLEVDEKTIKFEVRCFICDSPAKAFICQTVGHNSFHGCSKCMQIGRRIDNRTSYSTSRGIIRTDIDFSERRDQHFHKITSDDRISLENIGIKMITQFPLDPMHLLDLGITRKILNLIIKRKTIVDKLDAATINKVSMHLVSLGPYIPREFARKPRSFIEIAKWKATEFRQFILYTGIVVLKNVVSDDFFYHFCLLHCAYRLLLSYNYKKNLENASDMIDYFVELFPLYYSEAAVSFNVHSLLHITQCITDIGDLNSFTAYPYENYLQHLKRSIKKPQHILQQLHNHISNENLVTNNKNTFKTKFNKQKQVTSFQNSQFHLSLKAADKYCVLKNQVALEIQSFFYEKNILFIKAKSILNCTDFYTLPTKSKEVLGIFLSHGEIDANEVSYSVDLIDYKLMRLPFDETFLFIPILHSKV